MAQATCASSGLSLCRSRSRRVTVAILSLRSWNARSGGRSSSRRHRTSARSGRINAFSAEAGQLPLLMAASVRRHDRSVYLVGQRLQESHDGHPDSVQALPGVSSNRRCSIGGGRKTVADEDADQHCSRRQRSCSACAGAGRPRGRAATADIDRKPVTRPCGTPSRATRRRARSRRRSGSSADQRQGHHDRRSCRELHAALPEDLGAIRRGRPGAVHACEPGRKPTRRHRSS
jgi:hypothetical protein